MSSPSLRVRLRPHKTMKREEIIVGERIRSVVEETLPALVESISEIGLLYPILVSPTGELIDGEQRLAALGQLGVTDIPVIIDDNFDGAETHEEKVAALLRRELATNGVRTQFTPVQAAAARRRLRALTKVSSNRTGAPLAERRKGWSSELAVAETGVSRTTMDRVDRIVNIAEDDAQPVEVRLEAAEALTRIDEEGEPVDRALRSVELAAKDAQALERYPELASLPAATARVNMAAHLDSVPDEQRDQQIESLRSLWTQSAKTVADYQLLKTGAERLEDAFTLLAQATDALRDMRAAENLTTDLQSEWAGVAARLERIAEGVRQNL